MTTSPIPDTRIVLILGTNHCGSHLLSHLMGAHSSCHAVGELHRFDALVGDGGDRAIESDYATAELFAGLEALAPHERHAELAARLARAGAQPPIVLVDNSKLVEWIDTVERVSGASALFVHLVRDPRALVRRSLLRYPTVGDRLRQRLRVARRTRRPGLLFADFEAVCLYKWLRANRRIAARLEGTGRRFVRITYRDLALEPERTLRQVLEPLGLAFEPAQLAFGQSALLGTTKRAWSEATRASRIEPDLAWREELAPAVRERIATDPDVRRSLAEWGLELGPDGLTDGRKSQPGAL